MTLTQQKLRSAIEPIYSWSVLAAIPRRRLLAITKSLGLNSKALAELGPGRLAESLLDVDRAEIRDKGKRVRSRLAACKLALSHLSKSELDAIALRLRLTPLANSRSEQIARLMHPKRIRFSLPEGLEITSYIGISRDLREWIRYYVQSAEADGCELDFFSEEAITPVESTVRLICDIWPYCEWPDWLMWQRYGEPSKSTGKWIAEFESPLRWMSGRMVLQNPWDFAFSRLYMACNWDDITFLFRKPDNARISQSEHRWLAHAVLDGMHEDYENDEFILACTKDPRSLTVRIWNPRVFEAELAKADADGIVWLN